MIRWDVGYHFMLRQSAAMVCEQNSLKKDGFWETFCKSFMTKGWRRALWLAKEVPTICCCVKHVSTTRVVWRTKINPNRGQSLRNMTLNQATGLKSICFRSNKFNQLQLDKQCHGTVQPVLSRTSYNLWYKTIKYQQTDQHTPDWASSGCFACGFYWS